jgi:hypothetical protein
MDQPATPLPAATIPEAANAHLDTSKCAKHGCRRPPKWKFSFLYMTQFGALPLLPRECAVCDVHRANVETDLFPAFAEAFKDVQFSPDKDARSPENMIVDLGRSRTIFEPLPIRPC